MSRAAKKGTHHLEEFASFLAFLRGAGIDFSVIGGSAVGAYANLRGHQVLSADLDIYTSSRTLYDVVERVRATGVRILNEPKPRNIPVAVFEWEGKEVNVLSSSTGLPPPDVVLRLAREFHFKGHPGLSVLVADPLDLLANKLVVNRPKDRPHIRVLREFIEEEIVEAFTKETEPRKRISPAGRYLDVTHDKSLPAPLVERLVKLARLPSDFRFLANQVRSADVARELVGLAPEALREELSGIIRKRRLR